MSFVTPRLLSIIVIITFMGVYAAAPLSAQTTTARSGEKWEETPYLWAGKTLENLSPSVAKNIIPKYGELRFAYPSADACLSQPIGDSTEILDRDLIWYELETEEAVNVCLFRVFTALGSQAKIMDWLESQGFVFKIEGDKTYLGFLYGVEDERITQLNMTWAASSRTALYGVSEAQRKKLKRRVAYYTVGVTITEAGRVLWAKMYKQSVWLK